MSTFRVTVANANFSEDFVIEADNTVLNRDNGYLELWHNRQIVAQFAPGWSAVIKAEEASA